MITTPYFSGFRVRELLQFVNDVLSICLKFNPEKLQLTEKVEVLKSETENLTKAFKISAGSSISEEIMILDQRRDACVTGIHSYAEALSYHFDESISRAAYSVLDSFSKYGKNIARLNYQSETSTINSLSKEWESDSKLISALEALNLKTWAAELKTLNEEFNRLYLSRVSEKAESVQDAATQVRREVINSYRSLVVNLEARAELDTTRQYLPVINELNLLIDKYNKLINNRPAKSATTTSPAK